MITCAYVFCRYKKSKENKVKKIYIDVSSLVMSRGILEFWKFEIKLLILKNTCPVISFQFYILICLST